MKTQYLKNWVLVVIFIILLPGVGYIFNGLKLTDYDFNKPYNAECVRILGLMIPPLGAVLGFIDIEDK